MRWTIQFVTQVQDIHTEMENDESIAHALQEEEHFGARQEHFQTSNILAHSCVGALRRYPSLCTCNLG